MNKIAIPAILVATVMVAGMFAFVPVEQASTVHTSGTITTADEADITLILADTGTDIPTAITTINGFLDNEIATIITSTGTTLPNEHAALPSTTEVTNLSAPTTITAPGTLVASGTAGLAYVTCSGVTANGTPDTLEVGGTLYDDILDHDLVIAITSSQAIVWVIQAGADTGTCTAILMS